jgi:hypothetical protein
MMGRRYNNYYKKVSSAVYVDASGMKVLTGYKAGLQTGSCFCNALICYFNIDQCFDIV